MGARSRWVPLSILLFTILIVPVSYAVWFISNPPSLRAVLLLQPASTAHLYVHYSSLVAINGSIPLSGFAIPVISNGSLVIIFGATALPDTISMMKGTSLTVDYTISVPKNIRGYYWLAISQICPPLPVAVGVSEFQVSASDFPGLGGYWYCQALFFDEKIQSYSGLQMVFIRTNLAGF